MIVVSYSLYLSSPDGWWFIWFYIMSYVLGSILLVNSLRIIMVWYLDWLNFVLNEAIILLMMFLISWMLLPHHRYCYSFNQSMNPSIDLTNILTNWYLKYSCRALFSLEGLDRNLFPLFHMEELFPDPLSALGNNYGREDNTPDPMPFSDLCM